MRACIPLPSLETLYTLFEYLPETGILINKITRGSKAKVGDIAGRNRHLPTGRWCIKINGRIYLRARLIYKFVSGNDIPPGMEVDHINRNGLDDRFENLRLATSAENNYNRRMPKPTGLTLSGASPSTSSTINPYRSYIRLNSSKNGLGHSYYLGRSKTEIEAHLRYLISGTYFHNGFTYSADNTPLDLHYLPDLKEFTQITIEQLRSDRHLCAEFRKALDKACSEYWKRSGIPCPSA